MCLVKKRTSLILSIIGGRFIPTYKQTNCQSNHTKHSRQDHTGPLWINVVHIAYEHFDGCGEMQSSVATRAVITERASLCILTASIEGVVSADYYLDKLLANFNRTI